MSKICPACDDLVTGRLPHAVYCSAQCQAWARNQRTRHARDLGYRLMRHMEKHCPITLAKLIEHMDATANEIQSDKSQSG